MSETEKLPTLVILPGWGGTHETWRDFIALISEYMPVVCLDLPCFGTTPCPRRVFGVADYALYVQDRLREVSGDYVLLGHSFGGQVAAAVAAAHPQSLVGLVLVAPAIVRPTRYLRRAIFFVLAKIGNLIFRLPIIESWRVFFQKILHRVAGSPDFAETTGIKREIFKKIIREDGRANVSHISVKTLLIWGTRDRYTPYVQSAKILPHLKNVVFETVEGGTHGLHLKRTSELAELVKKFVYDF